MQTNTPVAAKARGRRKAWIPMVGYAWVRAWWDAPTLELIDAWAHGLARMLEGVLNRSDAPFEQAERELEQLLATTRVSKVSPGAGAAHARQDLNVIESFARTVAHASGLRCLDELEDVARWLLLDFDQPALAKLCLQTLELLGPDESVPAQARRAAFEGPREDAVSALKSFALDQAHHPQQRVHALACLFELKAPRMTAFAARVLKSADRYGHSWFKQDVEEGLARWASTGSW